MLRCTLEFKHGGRVVYSATYTDAATPVHINGTKDPKQTKKKTPQNLFKTVRFSCLLRLKVLRVYHYTNVWE